MLDIAFYSQDREEAEAIEVSNDFYEWLARSEFARIGKSELKEMKVDGETVKPTFRRYLDKFNSFKLGGIKP